MTVEEKWNKVNELCMKTACIDCPLLGETWDHSFSNGFKKCLYIKYATEEELDRALQLFGEFDNSCEPEILDTPPVNTCVSCGAEIPEGRQYCPNCLTLPISGSNLVTGDPIKPDYYNDTKITPFDVIDDWGLNFYLGNAVKYIKRAGKKAGNSRLQDLKKIREYIDHEIRAEEGER